MGVATGARRLLVVSVVLAVLLVGASLLSVSLYLDNLRLRAPPSSYNCQSPPEGLASPPPMDPAKILAEGQGAVENATTATASPLCPSGQLPIPVPAFSPKGSPGHSPGYYYADGSDVPPNDWREGGGVMTWVQSPAISSEASTHSLFELAVQGGPGNGDIIEIGWIVGAPAGSSPQLFVYHWVGWGSTCYNGCGWVQWNPSIVPGMTLKVGTQLATKSYMGYVYYAPQGNWWAWFANQWVGYFPASLWPSNRYTQNTLVQWFGEVYEEDATPDSDMGNGNLAAVSSAAPFSVPCEVDAQAWVCWIEPSPGLFGTSTWYTIESAGGFTFRYGGPGAADGAGVDP